MDRKDDDTTAIAACLQLLLDDCDDNDSIVMQVIGAVRHVTSNARNPLFLALLEINKVLV